MPKFSFEKLNPDDTHSINVSVYKPDGITSFFTSWFTKKEKNGKLPSPIFDKNYKLKFTSDDLNKLKINGIDLNKTQIANKLKNENLTGRNNVFVIPKTKLGFNEKEFISEFVVPNLKNKKHLFGLPSKKIRKKHIMSSSTISIKSKQSSVRTDLKCVKSIKSQRSIIHSVTSSRTVYKVGMKNSTNVHWQSKPLNKSVFVKSVPTAILKGNTQKKLFIPLYIGQKQFDKLNVLQPNKEKEVCKNQECSKEKVNAIPALLSKMKTMEEQLCSIESATKNINEVVSQNKISRTGPNAHDINKQKHVQGLSKKVVSHKIYSKIDHNSKKPKQIQPKKVKSRHRNKYTITKGISVTGDIQAQDLTLKTLNSESIGIGNNKNKNNIETLNDRPFLEHYKSVSSNILKKYGFQASPNSECNTLLDPDKSVPKTVSVDANLCTNINHQNKCRGLNLESSMSKDTFDWKHKSLTLVKELKITETNELTEQNCQFQKGKDLSTLLGIEAQNKYLSDKICCEFNVNVENEWIGKNDYCIPKSRGQNQEFSENLSLENIAHRDNFAKIRNTLSSNENAFNTEETQNAAMTTKEGSEEDILERKAGQSVNIFTDMKQNCGSILIDANKIEDYKNDERLTEGKYECQHDEENLVESSKTVQYNILAHALTENYLKGGSCGDIDLEDVSLCNDSHKNTINNAPKLCYLIAGKIPKPIQIDIKVDDFLKNEVELICNIAPTCEKSIGELESVQGSLEKLEIPIVKNDIGPYGDQEVKNTNSFGNNLISININTPNKILDTPSLNSGKNIQLSTKSNFFNKVDVGSNQKNLTESVCFPVGEETEYINQEKRRLYEELTRKCGKNSINLRPNITPFAKSCENLTNCKSIRNLSESALVDAVNTNKNHSFQSCQLNQKIFRNSDTECKHTFSFENQVFDYYEKGEKYGPAQHFGLGSNTNRPLTDFDSITNYSDMEKISPERRPKFLLSENKRGCLHDSLKDQNISDSKKRSCRYGVTLNMEQVFEESEKEEVTPQELYLGDHQAEKGDNITVQRNDDDSSIFGDKVEDYTLSKKSIECITNDGSCKKQNIPIGSDNLELEQSSISVQTDWSLIGFPVSPCLINCNLTSDYGSKKSVSSQTEVLRQQGTLAVDDMDLPVFCTSLTKSTQFNELITSNAVMCDGDSAQLVSGNDRPFAINLVEENVTEMKMSGVLFGVIQDKEKGTGETTHNDETADIMQASFTQILKQTSTQSSQNSFRSSSQEDALVQNNKSEGHLINQEAETFHHCSIPCFPSMSDDSLYPESNFKSLPSSKMFSGIDSTFSHIHKISNGFISSYNNTCDKHPPKGKKKLATITDHNRTPSIKPLCKVSSVPQDEKTKKTTSGNLLHIKQKLKENSINITNEIDQTPTVPNSTLKIKTNQNNTNEKGFISRDQTKSSNNSEIVRAQISHRESPGITCPDNYNKNIKSPSMFLEKHNKVSQDTFVNFVSIEYDSIQKRENSVVSYF